MAGPKVWNVYSKLRSAIREVWRYSPMRRLALKEALGKDKKYTCPICTRPGLEKWEVDVDHIEPCGSFLSFDDAPNFLKNMFSDNLRIICKLCHKKVTAEQRRKKK